ncbi:hypothetical protein CK203_014138 [Vitis vinifera]|uniref:Uncharacterized protein n=1 Tax=Vitis vinifera TaxID=29760 RepID=A0A438JHQ3_VITVI|nr:hypothetical protein CK203_014138 [Vitis vinifera]
MSGYDTRHDGNGESYRSHSKEGERGGSSPYDAFEERDSHHKNAVAHHFLISKTDCIVKLPNRTGHSPSILEVYKVHPGKKGKRR